MPDRHLDAIDYKKIFRNREKRLHLISKLRFIPTVPYLKLVYRIKTGQKLHLDNPVLFAEKLNWLKLHDMHPEYTNYTDKAYMKGYIASKYGAQYVIPCLGIFNSFEEIDFDKLPDSFVMKCTHDSASVKIIKDKNEINLAELKKFYNNRLRINSYYIGREYPYKEVPPRIIIEKYIPCEDGSNITDLKIMCFNGKVKAFYFISGKGISDNEFLTWFDENKNRIDVIDRTGELVDEHIQMPKKIDEMFKMAEELSAGIRFVRVDFFVNKDDFYFAEMTFYNNGGFVLLKPDKWEHYFGDLISTEE